MSGGRRLPVRLVLLFAVACGLSPRLASSAMVTIDFTGTVETVFDDGLLDGSLGTGTPFHLRAVYDDAALPEYSDAGNSAAGWSFSSPPFEFSLTVGSYSLVSGPQDPGDSGPSYFAVQLFDIPGFDLYGIASSGRVLSGTLGGELPVSSSFDVKLRDSAGTALDNYLDLASVPLDLSAWDDDTYSPLMSLNFEQRTASDDDPPGLQAGVSGRITALEYSVPEPPASIMAIAFLLASFMIRRGANC